MVLRWRFILQCASYSSSKQAENARTQPMEVFISSSFFLFFFLRANGIHFFGSDKSGGL